MTTAEIILTIAVTLIIGFLAVNIILGYFEAKTELRKEQDFSARLDAIERELNFEKDLDIFGDGDEE